MQFPRNKMLPCGLLNPESDEKLKVTIIMTVTIMTVTIRVQITALPVVEAR